MKKWILCLFLMAAPLFGQYSTTVSGNVKTISPNLPPNTNGSFAEFALVNCGNNTPMVNGVAVLLSGPVDFFVDGSGAITAAANSGIQPMLFGNDAILCGASQTSRYSVRYFVGGIATGPAKFYFVASNVPFNLSTAQPITLLPPLVYPNTTTCPAGSYANGINRDLSVKCLNLPSGASNAVVTNPAAAQEIAGFPLQLDGPFTAQSVNGIVNAAQYASLNAAVAACPILGGCTVDINNAMSLSGNLTLPATTTLRFNQPGLLNMAGFALTTGPVVAGPYHIFNNGSLVLSPLVSHPLVEWFGAVGDWNGTTGTDNTSSIQACIQALQSGQCVLQARSYEITTALNITRSNIGIAGSGTGIVVPGFVSPATISSALVSTSASANMINVTGTSPTASLGYNTFNDFALRRSVVTTSTATGMKFNFSYGATVKRVSIEDSGAGMLFHGTGGEGVGTIDHVSVAWGFGPVVATTGSYVGFFMDSADGVSNPSLRIDNSLVSSNLGAGVTTFGINATGITTNDLFMQRFETAGLSYGEFIAEAAGATSSLDIHFWGTINDNCRISCISVTGTNQSPASLEINGGWNFQNGPNPTPIIDLESASNVTITGVDLYTFPGVGPYIKVNGGSNNTITGNQFLGGATGVTSEAILTTASSKLIITNNQMPNITATTAIDIQGMSNGVIANNFISGSGTNAILLDASTHGVSGLSTNSITGTYSGAGIGGLNDLGINPTVPLYFAIGNGSIYKDRQQIRLTTGLCTAAANTGCTFTLTWPKAFPDANWAGICTVEASSGVGVIWAVNSPGKTTTTASVQYFNLQSTSNSLTQAVCEGWE